MSDPEPKPERITEADLDRLEATGTSNPLAGRLQELLIPEVRRLRALIAGDELRWKELLQALAETKHRPPLVLYDFIARLKTEAEAIWKERG